MDEIAFRIALARHERANRVAALSAAPTSFQRFCYLLFPPLEWPLLREPNELLAEKELVPNIYCEVLSAIKCYACRKWDLWMRKGANRSLASKRETIKILECSKFDFLGCSRSHFHSSTFLLAPFGCRLNVEWDLFLISFGGPK